MGEGPFTDSLTDLYPYLSSVHLSPQDEALYSEYRPPAIPPPAYQTEPRHPFLCPAILCILYSFPALSAVHRSQEHLANARDSAQMVVQEKQRLFPFHFLLSIYTWHTTQKENAFVFHKEDEHPASLPCWTEVPERQSVQKSNEVKTSVKTSPSCLFLLGHLPLMEKCSSFPVAAREYINRKWSDILSGRAIFGSGFRRPGA